MGFVECLYKTGVIQPFLHTKKKKKMPVQVRKKIIVIHSFDEFFFILQFSITGDFIESVFKLKWTNKTRDMNVNLIYLLGLGPGGSTSSGICSSVLGQKGEECDSSCGCESG